MGEERWSAVGPRVDWHAVLEVAPGSDAAAVRRAYLRACRKWHPDINASPQAEAHFKRVQDAYAALRDPQRAAAMAAEAGHDYHAPGGPRYPPYRRPGAGFRFRGAGIMEAALSRRFGWAMMALTPAWLVIAIGISTLSSESPTRFDADPMVRAGFATGSRKWLEPDTAHNLAALGTRKQLYMVPKSWLGTDRNNGRPPNAESWRQERELSAATRRGTKAQASHETRST